ncbi:hypothetical protein KBX49_09135 [Liquorilactobacillus satsumensis]|uniref:hypothetical protein n=1 Tax=Liquorilactobacillus satsumensis TaxID=259059 RepID=UPI0021C2B72F|nr:hypothetical protein [Liquorilactobacillus satsumensis]MCP9357364.1 hypothetical protein [Liquorilactobacillus satsumensis]MCP9372076.1 hypothetical protein [Liquorilactobacillus satsumensis]
MKSIFYFDEDTKEFTHSSLVSEDSLLPANAVEEAPKSKDGFGLFEPIKRDTVNNCWVGTSEEDFLKARPASTPSQSDQERATLIAEVAQASAFATQQATVNAELMATIAKLQGGDTK